MTTVIFVILIATWVIFVIDVVIRIALTPRGRRWHYAWHHPLEVLSAILPVFRALRVVGPPAGPSGPEAAHADRGPGAVHHRSPSPTRSRGCSSSRSRRSQAERDTPGANITTFGDAIWWAIVTITTVGYGDLYPVTPAGRFYAVLLMAGGIAIVGTASATIISYLNERVAGLRHEGHALAAPSLGTGEEPDPSETHALPPDDDASRDDDPVRRRHRATRRRPPGSLSG